MSATFQAEVVSADRVVWEGEATSVVVRTVEGDIGILSHHEPILAPLVPCAAEITTPDGRREVVAIEGGFLSMTLERCSLISQYARLAHEISLTEAEHELREAQRKLDEGDNSEQTMRHYRRARAQVMAVHKVA